MTFCPMTVNLITLYLWAFHLTTLHLGRTFCLMTFLLTTFWLMKLKKIILHKMFNASLAKNDEGNLHGAFWPRFWSNISVRFSIMTPCFCRHIPICSLKVERTVAMWIVELRKKTLSQTTSRKKLKLIFCYVNIHNIGHRLRRHVNEPKNWYLNGVSIY